MIQNDFNDDGRYGRYEDSSRCGGLSYGINSALIAPSISYISLNTLNNNQEDLYMIYERWTFFLNGCLNDQLLRKNALGLQLYKNLQKFNFFIVEDLNFDGQCKE